MGKLVDWIFGPPAAPRDDGLGADMEAALAVLVKRALNNGDDFFGVTVFNTNIRGVPTGNWNIVIQRPAKAMEARRAATGTGAVHDSAAPNGETPNV